MVLSNHVVAESSHRAEGNVFRRERVRGSHDDSVVSALFPSFY